jgi:hypothetical protein
MASEVNERLRVAARDNDVAGIAAALLAGADPNSFGPVDRTTPLQFAAASGYDAVIAALLAAGARVDPTDIHGWTPLMHAANSGYPSAVDALLAAGADVNHTSKMGFTALHYASHSSWPSATRVLVEAGARADVRSNYGKRPIDLVRALTCPLCRCCCGIVSRQCAAASPRYVAQVCMLGARSNKPAIRAILSSAAPWSRRRPVAIACYGDAWEWEVDREPVVARGLGALLGRLWAALW